jgi:RND family efflux transporter MFP subunit
VIAKAHVSQAQAAGLKKGAAATVRITGQDDLVPAKLSLVSPALDPGSTTIEVWLKVANKSARLKVGTPVKIDITGKSVAQAWKIPAAALLTAQDGSKSVMLVGSDGNAHKKAVTTGITDGEDVQILSGLAPSDMVITGGAYGLDEGTKVKVGPAEADDDAAKPDAGKADAGKSDDAKPDDAGKPDPKAAKPATKKGGGDD